MAHDPRLVKNQARIAEHAIAESSAPGTLEVETALYAAQIGALDADAVVHRTEPFTEPRAAAANP
jgi:hypothetical protein